MKKLQIFLLLAVLLAPAFLSAQTANLSQDSTKSNFRCNQIRPDCQYIKSYFVDVKDVIISPTKWSKKNWLMAGSGILATGIALKFDKNIQVWAQDNRTTASDKIAKFGLEPWGSGKYSLSLMGLFYAQGLIFKNDKSKATGLLGIKAFIVSGALINIPKYLFGRHRPYETTTTADPYNWEGPSMTYHSFVSGHTTASFAVASVIATQYADYKVVPYIAYTIAGLTGLSRINDNKHWASDVIGGALIGYGIGKLICNRNNWHITVFPVISTQGQALSCLIPLN